MEIYRIAYAALPLRDYLLTFYGAQGKPDLRYLQDQDFVLQKCRECGQVWQKEIPGEKLMNEVYETWIDPGTVFEKTESQRALGYFSYLNAEVIRVCRLFAQPPMRLTFLGYSMGWGHWCRAAQGLGCTVEGTEYSPSRVAYAKAHGVKVVDEDKLEPGRYDFINTEQVFEHLPDPLSVLRRLRAALAPKGFLRISVPNGGDIEARLRQADWSIPRGSRGSLVAVAPLEHVNCYNRACLVQMAKRCGLRPIPEPPGGSWTLDPAGLAGIVKACLRPVWRAIRSHPFPENLALFFRLDSEMQPAGEESISLPP